MGFKFINKKFYYFFGIQNICCHLKIKRRGTSLIYGLIKITINIYRLVQYEIFLKNNFKQINTFR